MSDNEKTFGQINVSDTINKLHDKLETTLVEMETLLTLPIDFLKSNMTQEDFIKYVALREKTIHALNLLEVFVYDTHEVADKCFECGETECKVVTSRRNGQEVERVNGEIEHWVTNGKIHHIFICGDCLKRQRNS